MPAKNKEGKKLAEHFFRHEYAKIVSIITGYFGLQHMDVAEDIVQDTLVDAMEQWSAGKVPDNPGGWLIDVARKKTINYLKRDQLFRNKIVHSYTTELEDYFSYQKEQYEDCTIRMIFACCHPQLPAEAQLAIALKTLCGLRIPEIASALLTNEATINKRLYRAKQKFRDGSISLELEGDGWGSRLQSVYKTIYLLFNEGYYSRHNDQKVRADLCYEAIRLCKQLIHAYPDEHEARALLALMLLLFARFDSRTGAGGSIIVLRGQDRSLWDWELINQGVALLHESIGGDEISSYQLQAGIAAEYILAKNFRSTNWASIVKQYRLLEQLDPGPVIKMNHLIARFYSGDQEASLTALMSMTSDVHLAANAYYHTALGVLLTELNRKGEAEKCFLNALLHTSSKPEVDLINDHLHVLRSSSSQ